jgi:uncharacterized spore protein YtfJ
MAKVLETLSESVPSWGVKLAHGEKVTVDGYELVPVALVGFGFGGGEGSGTTPETATAPAGTGEGSGGGGGGYAVPVGAYVGSPTGVKFRVNPVAAVVLAAPVVYAVGWAIAQIIRATRD